MNPIPNRPERPLRKRSRAGGHAPGPEGEPLCGASPQEVRFSDPPSCSQCASVLSLQAGRVKKKKNRVKGKHAKGKDGKPICGVEAKKVHYSKTPSCTKCKEALGAAAPAPEPKAPSRAALKRKAREAKTATWVFADCPLCEAKIPEHRMARHMKKIHSETGRQPDPE